MFTVTHFRSEFVRQNQATILRKVTMTQFMLIIAAAVIGVGLFGAPFWLAPLFIAYAVCALFASLAGILLTARVESGETNIGGTVALESIAACVIAGVSLRGGIGRVESVVLGAFFIVLVQNGMNILQIGSYMQMVLLGSLLVLAVVIDQLRYRMLVSNQ